MEPFSLPILRRYVCTVSTNMHVRFDVRSCKRLVFNIQTFAVHKATDTQTQSFSDYYFLLAEIVKPNTPNML